MTPSSAVRWMGVVTIASCVLLVLSIVTVGVVLGLADEARTPPAACD